MKTMKTMKIVKYCILISLIFFTKAYGQYEIYAQVSAKIIDIAAVSQTFKKGEVLVRLDDRIAQAVLAEQKAILAIKEQLEADAKLIYGQTQQLFDNLVRSKRELELAEIAYHQAKYQTQAQKAKVQQQILQLEKYQILAPFDLLVRAVPQMRNVTNHREPKPLLQIIPLKSLR